jgi:hypothetical protein
VVHFGLVAQLSNIVSLFIHNMLHVPFESRHFDQLALQKGCSSLKMTQESKCWDLDSAALLLPRVAMESFLDVQDSQDSTV